MNKWVGTLFFVLSSVGAMFLAYAQSPQNPPQPPMQYSPPPPPPSSVSPDVNSQSAALPSDMPVFQNPEGYNYDPTGRRDPFKPYGEAQVTTAPEKLPDVDLPPTPKDPLQSFDVGQFRLLGIIWQVKDPKAMIADPSGKTYLVRKQTRIGRNNGFIAAIREGEVIVVEPSVLENGIQTAVTRTLSLK